MEFIYKNNKKDIQTYAEYIFKNSVFSRKKFIYYNLFFIVFIIGIIYMQYVINNISGNELCWLLLKSFIVVIAVQYIFSKKYIYSIMKDLIKNRFNTEVYIKIKENKKISIICNNLEITSNSKSNIKLIKYKNMYFLTVDKKTTVIIPKRVFRNVIEEEKFKKEVEF